MNPDQPSREQIEARLTALLLGELPAAEAELLRWSIARDPELRALHDQLKLTIGFVREAMKNPAGAPAEREAPMKMSQERRQRLLAHFKTERPKPLVPPLRRGLSPLIVTLVVVAVIALLAAMLLPVLSAAKRKGMASLSDQYSTLSVAMQNFQPTTAGERDTEMEQQKSLGLARANSRHGLENKLTRPAPPAPATTPPVRIVLPDTESAKEESTENSGTEVYSQSVVGYVNTRLPEASTFAVTPIPRGSAAPIADTAPGSLEETPAMPTVPAMATQSEGQIASTIAPSVPGLTIHDTVSENPSTGIPASVDNTFAINGTPENGPVPQFRDREEGVKIITASQRGTPAAAQPFLPPRLRSDYRHPAEVPHHAPVGVTAIPGEAGPEVAAMSAGTITEAPPPEVASAPPMAGVEQAPKRMFEGRTGLPAQGQGGGGGGGGGGYGSGRTENLQPNPPNSGGSLKGLYKDRYVASENQSASPLISREMQNPNNVAANSDRSQSVTDFTLNPATGLPEAPLQPQYTHKANLREKYSVYDTLPSANESDLPLAQQKENAPIPQPEVQTRDNAFSTFSLNVSDVSFTLANASLGNGKMPDPGSIRSEEFLNAFDYHDPEPLQGQPLAFTYERAQDPFEQERDLLRFSVKAGAMGRQEGRALNLVLLLDTSGSMERADRVAIIRAALRVLAAQLQPQDTVSVVTFARTARLWADGIAGDRAGETLDKVGNITPEGGTNLEEAMRLAYETALRHFLAGGINRVVLLTDGAANLGNVDPQALTQKVEAERRQGIALDCFGIGWEDYNDDLLEQLSSNGDGRYAFINSPDEAATEFAAKLAGALEVAAEDVKVQVEFNPNRVTAWRQIGYAKHQLTKEQFRDNSVAAGAIAAREAGNALYAIETDPNGQGPIATVRVRYRVPGTQDNRERSWLVNYTGAAPALAQSSPAMRLAVTASEFSEWLAGSPFAQNVSPEELLNYLSGVPQFYGTDERPKQLEWMIRQAKSVSGK